MQIVSQKPEQNVLGWGVGGVLVGCLQTPHHAETPVYKGAPKVLGGVWGVLRLSNVRLQVSQTPLMTFSASAYDFLSVRYGDADTLLTTFQQFPRWE